MTMHMLSTPMEEVSRRPHGDERWCFQCRATRSFKLVVTSPIVSCWCPIDGPRDEHGEGVVEFSTGAWYGPTREVRCVDCGMIDGDLFPGRWREWEE